MQQGCGKGRSHGPHRQGEMAAEGLVKQSVLVTGYSCVLFPFQLVLHTPLLGAQEQLGLLENLPLLG